MDRKKFKKVIIIYNNKHAAGKKYDAAIEHEY